MSESKSESKGESKGLAFDPSELAAKGEGLSHVERSESKGAGYDPEVAEAYARIFENHEGDIEAVFKELDEDPDKCLRYPPDDAADFGRKYAQGFYTFVADA